MQKDAIIRIEKPLWKRVQRIAKKRRLSGAAMLRVIIQEWLEANKETKK